MPRVYIINFLFILLGSCTSHPRRTDSPIRIRWPRDPETLDPLTLPNQQAIDAANLLHVGLLQNDYQANTYTPGLAEAIPTRQLLGDSLSQLTYCLRAEATWDDGRPVLATDVAFTLKLMHCAGLPNEGSRAELDFIEACQLDPADPRRFILLCRGQAPEYTWTSGDFPVLPENVFDAAHSLRAYSLKALRAPTAATLPPVAALVARYQQANVAHHPERLPGCGPYRLVSWQTNRSLVFERKATWWADRLPDVPFALRARAQQLQFLILPDAAAAMLGLRRHELDVFPQVPTRLFQQLRASSKELAFYTTKSNEVVMMGFNTQKPTLRDRSTRRALSLLLNPAALRAATQIGQGQLTASLLAPTSPYYNDSLRALVYDPNGAANLLRQAGWQRQVDGTWHHASQAAPLHLRFCYRTDDPTFLAIGLQFQAAAGRLGIGVDLQPAEGSLFSKRLRQGDFDLCTLIIRGNPFAYNFAPLLHSQSVATGNFMRFANSTADRLLTAITQESQPARKQRLLNKFQVLLREEMPLVPLFVLPYRIAADHRLHDLTPTPLRPGYAAAAMHWALADTLAAH